MLAREVARLLIDPVDDGDWIPRIFDLDWMPRKYGRQPAVFARRSVGELFTRDRTQSATADHRSSTPTRSLCLLAVLGSASPADGNLTLRGETEPLGRGDVSPGKVTLAFVLTDRGVRACLSWSSGLS
jgi:hypothetical protein